MRFLNLVRVAGKGLFTFNAYCALRDRMSEQEFKEHKYEIVTVSANLEHTDLNNLGEFIIINQGAKNGID